MRIFTAFFLASFLSGCQQDSIVTYQIAKETQPPLLTNERAPAEEGREIMWKLPKGWKEQSPSAMRVGSFLVAGKNGQPVDISIVSLAGDAGGDLANVNRWRGQINLPPLGPNELDQQSQAITPAGRRMLLVDYVSTEKLIDNAFKKRLIAAVYVRGEKSWFFKMTGEDESVKMTKPSFLKFLDTLSFRQHE